MNATVTLIMLDELTNQIVNRTIDITNAMCNIHPCWTLRTKEDQRRNLERWIDERGNAQHDTLLTLQSWTINRN